jgi:hypothetical protein
MNRKHSKRPPWIGLYVCCFLSACQVVPDPAEVPHSKVDTLAPPPLPSPALTDTPNPPAPAETNRLLPKASEPRITNKAIRDVAIGDDPVTALKILGEPVRSTQVATSNGECMAWEYFYPPQKNPSETSPKLKWLIIFDQKTSRVKTIEQYPR